MKIAICKLKSKSPYSQSKFIDVDKLQKELPKDFEKRVWRERMHKDEETGCVMIPPMVFGNCIKDAAKYLSISVPGGGKATYTKNFSAGVFVSEPIILPIKVEDVPGEWLLVPSDGKKNGTGSKVQKCFGRIDKWDCTVEFSIFDDIITQEVFEQVLKAAGMLIGIGRFRPRNGGFYGKFEVVSVDFRTIC